MNETDDIINPLKEIFSGLKQIESRWLKVECADHIEYECHECECTEKKKSRYCPNCGSRMVNYEKR